MKTIKVSEATNAQLDWLVAKCEGHAVAVLTVDEQRVRWVEDAVTDNEQEKLGAEYDEIIAPTAKPEICVLCVGGYKRVPYHSEAPMLFGSGVPTFQYTTSWLQMGPIIDREKISIRHWDNIPGIHAYLPTPGSDWSEGPTSLVAAARCYVASKLGATAAIPDEL